MDFDPREEINNLNFYSDAAKNGKLRFGCILSNFWTYGPWNENFIKDCNPSIEYLKLFGVVAGILTWTQELTNDKYLIHCDKQSVVQMLNSSTYSCKNCMVLIRILTLDNLVQNRRIVAKFIPGVKNKRADSLSRIILGICSKKHEQIFNNLSKSGQWKNYGCHDSASRLKMTIRSTCFTKNLSLCRSRNFKFETMCLPVEENLSHSVMPTEADQSQMNCASIQQMTNPRETGSSSIVGSNNHSFSLVNLPLLQER